MKVFVIFEEVCYDYEGSSCQNIGVFLSRKKAFARVKTGYPQREKRDRNSGTIPASMVILTLGQSKSGKLPEIGAVGKLTAPYFFP
jgi:hypothetical protein